MVIETSTLVRQKGQRVKTAVALLAIAAALIVAGTLVATGDSPHNVRHQAHTKL
jgi:hypothetical protein